MKGKDWLILGGLAVGAYLLYNYFKGGVDTAAQGGGMGATTTTPIIAAVGQATASRANTIVRTIHSSTGSRQQWLGAQFGQKGQPSLIFARNTLLGATYPNAPQTTRMAAQALIVGAPPRIVAKIKAGKVF